MSVLLDVFRKLVLKVSLGLRFLSFRSVKGSVLDSNGYRETTRNGLEVRVWHGQTPVEAPSYLSQSW